MLTTGLLEMAVVRDSENNSPETYVSNLSAEMSGNQASLSLFKP